LQEALFMSTSSVPRNPAPEPDHPLARAFASFANNGKRVDGSLLGNLPRVVVAVNGRILWSDIFASTELLEKYWPKLVRSYASEAVVTRAKGGEGALR